MIYIVLFFLLKTHVLMTSDYNSVLDKPLESFTCLHTGLASLGYKLHLMTPTCHRRPLASV